MARADVPRRRTSNKARGSKAPGGVSHAKSHRVARTDRARKAERRAQGAQERLEAALGAERRTE